MRDLHNALKLRELYILKGLGYRYTDMEISEIEPEVCELPESMEALREMVQECHLCELSKTRRKVVFGEGDTNASVMFVGEGPGAMEDSTGRPFVGRSGELLTKMIENVLHIPRRSVYIANIVKCRPPLNRVPTTSEAIVCRPYLMKQIDIVSPSLIVTLGATAYRYLTDDETPVGKVRGNIIRHRGMTILPTYHPSYLLRNPSAKREAYSDLLKVAEFLSNS